MTDQVNSKTLEYPGFRYVLGAALVIGVIGGLTDVSYTITRSPDLIADVLHSWRFITAGIFLTTITMVPYLAIAWLILRPIVKKRNWTFELTLATIYLLAFIPAGLITIRNFSLLLAGESLLVVQVKALYYSLKYIWIVIPISWAISIWLARLQATMDPSRLYGNMSGIAFSAAFYLFVNPYWQQAYLLEKANVTSEMASTDKNMVMVATVFIISLILIPLSCWFFRTIARPSGGKFLIAVWVLLFTIPYIPAIFATGRLVGTPPSGNELAGKPRNVVLISMDTTRYDEMGFNGAEITETPFLDSIANESLVFDNAITPMPMTGPAHISMFTGLQPESERGHGIKSNGMALEEGIPTLGTILDNAGYNTGAVVAGFPLARRTCGLAEGMHYYHDDFGEGLRSRFLPDQVWYLTVAKIFKKVFNVRAGLPHGLTKSADDVTDQAIDFLEESSDEPFFLFVHYFDPHYLYAPPPPFDTKYTEGYDGGYKDIALTMSQIMSEMDSMNDEDLAYYRALYRGEISFLDQELQRLWDWGESDGRNTWDDTLFIVVSDHGEGFEHNYYFKHTDRVYDQLIHVPMMVRDPDRIEDATRNNDLVNVSDIYFTVLNWLDIESPRTPEEMHSGIFGAIPTWDHDLLGLMDVERTEDIETFRDWTTELPDDPEVGWYFIASQSYTFTAEGEQSLGRFFSFRFPDWKIIHGPDSAPTIPTYQFFDLLSDPEEMDDIYPSINWADLGLPDMSEALNLWASTQAAADLSGLSAAEIAELKALGYINEGP